MELGLGEVDSLDKISKAKLAIEESEAKSGEMSLETSYKWDELAAALKECGQLLDAANATAKAKSIRASVFAKDSKQQEAKIGKIATSKNITAVGALKVLYGLAICVATVLVVVAIFLPSKTFESFLSREALGSISIATLIQLCLFPIKSIPRPLKYVIVAIASGVFWSILGVRI